MSIDFNIENLRQMKPVCGIYAISGPNGRRYVGQGLNVGSRLRGHWRDLAANRHHCIFLQRAWVKYEGKGFTCEVLMEGTPEMLTELEQHWMDYHRVRGGIYNTAQAAGSMRGFKHSMETRVLLSAQRIGNKNTLGYKQSEETRAKCRDRSQRLLKTGWRPAAGMIMSPEHKAAIVAANTNREKSIEERAKIAATHKGKPKSKEHREKIRVARTGSKRSEEAKRKTSETFAKRKALGLPVGHPKGVSGESEAARRCRVTNLTKGEVFHDMSKSSRG